MLGPKMNARWGDPPWTIDFRPRAAAIAPELDYAVVGGGFTGLACAAWLKRLSPLSVVGLFESGTIGAGSSGRTGGMALSETAAGDMPGLGDVLAGFTDTLATLKVECDLSLPGVWELGRGKPDTASPISWADAGVLQGMHAVLGGTIDPGRLVAGLARAAQNLGVNLFERCAVENKGIGPSQEFITLTANGTDVRAKAALFATNAASLELSGLAGRGEPTFTLAVATEPLAPHQIAEIGLGSGKPFYTVDFPYLWGRLLPDHSHGRGVIFGAGLVHVDNWREIDDINIDEGPAAAAISRLQMRVRGLHRALHDVNFTHQWGGPILISNDRYPIFARHPANSRGIVLGGYSGHGVALSVYLGRWAAEAMLGVRELPDWDRIKVAG